LPDRPDRALDLLRRAGVIHVDVAAFDMKRGSDFQRVVVAIDLIFIAVSAVGNLFDVPAHGSLGKIMNRCCQLVEILKSGLLHEARQPVRSDDA